MEYAFNRLFPQRKPILAMIHLKGETAEEKLDIAKREIDIYYRNGVDAVIIEDYFAKKGIVQLVLEYLAKERRDRIYGVNVLDNFHRSFELAYLYGAAFLQVDSIAGQLPLNLDRAYGEMIAAYRAVSDILVFGGVRFKYQDYLSGRSLEEDLRIGMGRCDAIVVTGEGTGIDTDNAKLREFRDIVEDFPLIVGAGVTVDTAAEKLSITDGAIVGSFFKDSGKDSGDVSDERVARFMKKIREIRG